MCRAILVLCVLSVGCVDFDELDRCFARPCGGARVQDDFSGSTLDPSWTFVGPQAGAYALENGLLRLTTAQGEHDCWGAAVSCVRLMRPDADTDAVYEVALDNVSLTHPQSIGILLFQDPSNHVRFEMHHDGTSHAAYAFETLVSTSRAAIRGPNIATGRATYLRVTRKNRRCELAFSHEGTLWQSVGSTACELVVKEVGLHLINATTPASARVDWFAVDRR